MTDASEKGATLFEMLRGKIRGAPSAPEGSAPRVETPADLFNPLKLALGGFLRIETPDLSAATFSVEIISEFTRKIGKSTLKFSDYSLHDPDTGGKDGTWVTLRVIPSPKKDDESDYLLLRPAFEGGYTKKLEKILDGNVLTDEDTGLKYRKVAKNNANIREYSGDGEKRLSLDYWDFINEEEPQPRFYVVEMDLSDREGWIQSYRGTLITRYDVKPVAGNTSQK